MAHSDVETKYKELRRIVRGLERDAKRRDQLVVELHGLGEGPTRIAAAMNVTRGRVHQVLADQRRRTDADADAQLAMADA